MQTCPLQLTIYSTVHPDPVRIDNTTAVIYRRLNGRYYIKVGYYRLNVVENEDFSFFELRMSETMLRFVYGALKTKGYIKP
jgi:hypothetical protein